MSATADAFRVIPSRPPPMATEGVLPWLKRNLFADWKNTLGTIVVVALFVRCLPPLLDWAVWNAVARPDNAACRALDHAGACWGVVAEKYRLIPGRTFFGAQNGGGLCLPGDHAGHRGAGVE